MTDLPSGPFSHPILLSEFAPISLQTFLNTAAHARLVERHKIFDKFQSGFRHKHSTETTLLRMTNDILMHADKGEYFILILLDCCLQYHQSCHFI